MALKDLLAEEAADVQRAAHSAAQGVSMTGFSGRHTSTDQIFGEAAAPLVGARLGPMTMHQIAPDGIAASPAQVTRERRPMPANRQPFGAHEQQLAWRHEPGFRLYWFSDIPGRLVRAKRAGYEHVLDDSGAPVSRVTDRADGRGRSSYLMKIPIEWYQEDMRVHAENLASKLNDIRRGRGVPGAEVDNHYIPKEGIKITGR